MVSKKKRLLQRLEAATSPTKKEAAAVATPFRVEPEEPPVELAAFIGATIIGLLIIMALAIFFGTRSIEGTLEFQTLGTLRASGIRDVAVEANGMNLTLHGTVNKVDHIELAAFIATTIEGVGEVDVTNIVYVPPPSEVEPDRQADPLVFSWSSARIDVSGTLSDEATLASVIDALGAVWETVDTSEVQVKEAIASQRDWLPAIVSVVTRAGGDLDQGTVIANPNLGFVLVAGEAETRGQQVAVLSDVEEIVSKVNFEFTSGLTIKEQPPPPTVVASPGAPTTTTTTTTLPPIVVELQESLDDLIEGKVVEFEFGSSVITPQGRELLDEVLDALRKFPDVRLQIGGHTDDVGSVESNLLLSRLRAASVLTYLVDREEDPGRFDVIGYGEDHPIAENTTEDGRARNRRIEFTALSE